jgi:hypothetical protein
LQPGLIAEGWIHGKSDCSFIIEWTSRRKAMKTKLIAVITALALIAVPLSAFAMGSPQPAAAQKGKAWTYLIYLDGDNNLDTWGDYSLNLMKNGLTNDANMNVVVLQDHLGSDAYLRQVTSSGITTVKDYGEPDMADPAVLQTFLTWGVQTYPADHYAVVVWDHGGGWKDVIFDETSNDRMLISDLGHAIGAVVTSLHRKFDITIFDACLMTMAEVTDQLKPVTNYMVASEQSVEDQGFPYDAMFQQLSSQPSMDAWTYSKLIADDFYNFYVGTNGKSVLSISAIDESKLPSLVKAIDNLSITLIADMPVYHGQVSSARSNAQHQIEGTNGVFWYVDLHVFADQIAFRISDATIDSKAAAVSAAVENTLYERHSHNLDGKAYGLAINFPPDLSRYIDKSYLAQNYQGVNLVFTAETHWDEMLLASYQY